MSECNGLRISLLAVFLYCLPCLSLGRTSLSEPLIWNMDDIKALKTDFQFHLLRDKIIVTASEYCKTKSLSVIYKRKSFAPDMHYYCSIGTYWWPDPTNPNGKYVNRDGQTNPERADYDINLLTKMERRCTFLSLAFYLTGNPKYYDAFLDQISTWFINRKTYMYPNMEYSQVVPGYNNNKGRSVGMIDAYVFNSVLDAIRLVNTKKKMDGELLYMLKSWFLSFADWVERGNFGEELRKSTNNIGVASDVTLMNMYLFAGKKKLAKQIARDFYERRIEVQIDDEGKQNSELRRTNAMSYSIANLNYILDFCFLSREVKANFYRTNKSKLNTAFSFIAQYIYGGIPFPYQQISGTEASKFKYQIIENRRKMLSGGLYNKSVILESLIN